MSTKKTTTTIVTNFLTIVSDDKLSIEKAKGYMLDNYAMDRIVSTNADIADFDNLHHEYLYNETFDNLANLVQNTIDTKPEFKNVSAITCQFTTNSEMTEADLNAISSELGSNITVILRWHLKRVNTWRGDINEEQNPLTANIRAAGYISIT